MRPAFLSVLLATQLLAADTDPRDPKAPLAREINVTGLKPIPKSDRQVGTFGKPAEITSAAELAKAIPDKAGRQKVVKAVDFGKEYLLLFRWGGSSSDRLEFKVEKGKKGPEVVFTYTASKKLDLDGHPRLFAIAKGTA